MAMRCVEGYLVVGLFLGAWSSVRAEALGPALPQVRAQAPGTTTASEPARSYTLAVERRGDRLGYVGVEGALQGVANPALVASEGELVHVTIVNQSDAIADFAIPGWNVESAVAVGPEARTTVVFEAKAAGSFVYGSASPELRAAGLAGLFIVQPRAPASPARVASAPSSPSAL